MWCWGLGVVGTKIAPGVMSNEEVKKFEGILKQFGNCQGPLMVLEQIHNVGICGFAAL